MKSYLNNITLIDSELKELKNNKIQLQKILSDFYK